MLNRFRNVIYGTSSAAQDDSEVSEAIISKRIRSALTRSSSFREELLRVHDDTGNNNSTHSRVRNKEANLESLESTDTARDYSIRQLQNSKPFKVPKYQYTRPEFLQLKTEDEILVSADHQIRPIILPRDVSRLPWKSGYAECINAGKSARNEDQAACYQNRVLLNNKPNSPLSSPNSQEDLKKYTSTIEFSNSSFNPDELPWIYFGVFDGHAGPAVAVAAAAELHRLVAIKLNQISDLLMALEFDFDRDDEDSSEYLDCAEKLSVLADQVANTNKEPNQCEGSSSIEGKRPSVELNNNSSETSPNQQKEPLENGKGQCNSDLQSKDLNNEDEPSKKDINQISRVDDKLTTCPKGQEAIAPAVSSETQEPLNVRYVSPKKRYPSVIDMYRNNITVDSLVIGALESSFWEMDAIIAQDKNDYKMSGGCTAIVGLFIMGKLYVCNAGDSRAIVYKDNQVVPMSFDFTPTSERERILRLGLQHPEFLGNDFTHLEFIKRPIRKDIGKQMLYKDAYMTGWSMKTITRDDLKFPLVWGEGKRSRVLATIGVTRGFGDHELRALYGSVHIKPFLTPEPEVKVLPLEHDENLTAEDVLIMGTDGLWDVTSNQEAANIVKSSFNRFPDNEESRSKYRYITAAQDLVIHSRGETKNWSTVWRTEDDRLASLDDIAVFVIPLKQYRDEYLEWKKIRINSQVNN